MKKHSTDTGNRVPADLNPDESRLGERTEFMTRAGRWCNGSTPPPVGGDPGSNPVASAKESASDTVCGFLFAVLAQWSVLQSSKLMMRVRFPYTARYDSMPVGSSRRGSHDHAGRVRWFTPPFVRRTREYRQRPSSYGWMMRTALCRKGWCESDKAYPPSAGKVSWNAGDRVSCQPNHRMWKRSRGAWGFSPCDPCHASCCSMRVHRKHECKDPARVVESTVDCAGISLRIACACFRGPTGRANAPRTHPVRVRIPAKALAETRASTPPIRVLNACLFWGTMHCRAFAQPGPMTNAASASAPNLRIRCQRRHPPAAILGRSGTMVKARTLHLSGLNRTAFPASYPQHGFVVQSVRMPRFWGDAGSNPVEARWAQWPHAKRWVPEREIVCDRWHEPVAGQEFLCSHGPSAVPHAGTVSPS